MWRSNKTQDEVLSAMCLPELVVLDTETTGFNAVGKGNKPEDRIIQFSGIKYRVEDDDIIQTDVLDTYIHLDRTVPPKITELTGITDAILAPAPSEDDAFARIKAFLDGIHVIVAYNTPFDMSFIRALYKRHGEIFEPDFELDVLAMARDIVSKEESASHKLGAIAALYGADAGLTFHNSLDDVTATARLLRIFYREYKERVATMHKMTSMPKRIATILQMNYWPGFRGCARIYIETTCGSFYYDIRNQSWNVNAKRNSYHLEEIDMEQLRKDAFVIANAATEQEFARYRG